MLAGGGHKASAKAIQAALEELYPGKFCCEISDIWTDYGPWPYNTFVESYQWLAKHMWAWRLMYYYGLFPPTQKLTQLGADIRCFTNFKGVSCALTVALLPTQGLLQISLIRHCDSILQHAGLPASLYI